ncbi:G-alpha-domain-containing protein [Hysterangium stoloniferum]|nr:G-alpha-domain-containing protein [Hysterangium stoloniferum]
MALSVIRIGGRRSLDIDMDDPLARELAPPEGETEEQAELRIIHEKAAQKISDDIDRELRSEELAAKKRKCVKILLLGQSESGKSTVLKNFQRKYDPTAFDREREVWRSVCQLNVVRSFGIILDILNEEDGHLARLTPPTSPRDLAGEPHDTDTDADTAAAGPVPVPDPDPVPAAAPTGPAPAGPTPTLTAHHRRLMARLTPLRQIEQTLTKRLTPAPARPLSPPQSPLALTPSRSQQELHDRVVKALLAGHKVGKEELCTFFLDDLPRIAVPNFTPTDDDILRARLKTMGVTEHRYTIRPKFLETDNLGAAELRIYDVGGARSTWMPYFDDANAIIFLAPMSAFDQALAEAPEVNRLEDTFMLWKNLCSSKLLARVSIVLLLNKRDILQAKLDDGIRFGRYVKSYTGRNQWESVARYLKSKFKAVQKELSPQPRLFYSHITCATDTRQMAVILSAIEDLVLRKNLEQISLL